MAEDPAGVLNLARTSKTNYFYCQPAIQSAVKSLIFHDIKIAIPRPRRKADLKGIVNRLVKRLKAADTFDCVRRVFIAHPKLLQAKSPFDTTRFYEEEDEWRQPCLSTLLSFNRVDKHTTQYGQWLETPLRRHPREYRKCDQGLPSELYEPVAKLIEILPSVTDVIWTWSPSVTPCILDVLHRKKPQCGLHLDYFFGEYVFDRDTLNVMWHSSPSLQSIRIGPDSHNFRGSFAQRERLLRSVIGAPNLKELRLSRNEKAPNIRSENEHLSEKLSLEALHFESTSSFDDDIMYGWSHYIDLSTLQTLKIHGRLNGDDLFNGRSQLNRTFPYLRALRLNISSDELRPAEFYESVNNFLHTLPQLTELELDGWHSMINIESLVAYHGPSLGRLKLLNPAAWQFVNEKEIRLINRACPLLEELRVPLNRSQNELGLYRALASIRNLRSLYIHYEILPFQVHEASRVKMTSSNESVSSHTNMPLDDPSFDEFQSQPCERVDYQEHQLRNGHVERIIVDSIIDQKLASEIFQVIADAKPLGSIKLNNLTISVSGSNYGHSISMLVDTFGKSWYVRHINASSRGRGLLIMAEEIQSAEENAGGYGLIPESIEPIFRRAFPEQQHLQRLETRQPRKTSKKLGTKRQDEMGPSTWKHHLRAAVPAWSPRSSTSRNKRREKISLRSGKASWGMLIE